MELDIFGDLFGKVHQSHPRSLPVLEAECGIDEPDYPDFDFSIFSDMVSAIYSDFDDHPYTLKEVLEIFQYFFTKHYEYIGNHPPVSKAQIIRFLDAMPYLTAYTGGINVIDPLEYPDIIDEYFESDFKNCNYRINHFFSGKIRLITKKKVERNMI